MRSLGGDKRLGGRPTSQRDPMSQCRHCCSHVTTRPGAEAQPSSPRQISHHSARTAGLLPLEAPCCILATCTSNTCRSNTAMSGHGTRQAFVGWSRADSIPPKAGTALLLIWRESGLSAADTLSAPPARGKGVGGPETGLLVRPRLPRTRVGTQSFNL